jgi:hypothetical protein
MHDAAMPMHFHHLEPCAPGSLEYDIWESTRSVASQLRTFGPEDLVNMAEERRAGGIDAPALVERNKSLQVGDRVTMCFKIKNREKHLPPELRDFTHQMQSEGMLVKVTAIEGKWPSATYQGVLLNMPILLSPDELTLGSQVRFSPDYIHSI